MLKQNQSIVDESALRRGACADHEMVHVVGGQQVLDGHNLADVLVVSMFETAIIMGCAQPTKLSTMMVLGRRTCC